MPINAENFPFSKNLLDKTKKHQLVDGCQENFASYAKGIVNLGIKTDALTKCGVLLTQLDELYQFHSPQFLQINGDVALVYMSQKL